MQNLIQMANHHARKQGSIALSDAKTEAQNEVLGGLKMTLDGILWDSKPQDLVNMPTISGFGWLKYGDKFLAEDHASNRTAYMKHLRDQVNLPPGHSWYDAQPTKSLLDVDVEVSGLKRNLKGTTDVVIAETKHVTNVAVRNHVVALLELKKENNLGNHEPQVCLEHLAASILNPLVPVLTCLTDLNRRWTFYWFGYSKNVDRGVAIKKLVLTDQSECAKLAKYLLESFAKRTDATPGTLPETFMDRLSWKQVQGKLGDPPGGTNATRKDDDEEGAGKSPGKESSGGKGCRGDETGPSLVGPNHPASKESHQQKKHKPEPSEDNLAASLRLLCPRGDVANELDLLDMMDEDDRIRTVRGFLRQHVVPHITGADPENRSTDKTEERDATSFLSAGNLAHHTRSTHA